MMRMHRNRPGLALAFGVALMTLSSAGPVRAQPLAEQVPGDAVAYVGWRGAANLESSYQDTRLKAMLSDTNLPQRVSGTLGRLLEKHLPAAGPQAPQGEGARLNKQTLMSLADLAWQRPWAVYLTGARAAGGEGEAPRVDRAGFLIQAGEQAEQLRPWLKRAIAEYDGPAHSKPRLLDHEGLLGLVIGERAIDQPLAEQADFREAMQRFDAGDAAAFTAWADVNAIRENIENAIKEQAPEARSQPLGPWPAIREALGLAGVERIAVVGRFAGRDWQTDLAIDAPAPRQGLVKLLAGEPLRQETFQLAPRNATWLRAFHFDLGEMFDLARRTAEAVGPKASQRFGQGLGMVRGRFGIDLEKLIRGLGDQWVTYSHPAFGGYRGMSISMLQNLKQPAQVRQVMGRVKQVANRMLKQKGAPFQITEIDMGELKIQSLGVPMVSPSWAISDGRLYFALSPHAISTMHRHAGRPDRSILNNKKFMQMRDRLGAKQPSGLMFANVPRTAATYYQNYVMWLGMVAPTVQQRTGVDLMGIVPPLGKLRPHLAPAGGVSWADESGYHQRIITPFPGATLLSPEVSTSSLTTTGPLMAGIILPGVYQAREAARAIQSLSNMREFAVSMALYSNDHDGAIPRHMGQLVDGNYLHDPSVMLHPASEVSLPNDFAAKSAEAKHDWLRQHASYIYIGESLPQKMQAVEEISERVVLFEKPRFASGEGIGVAFADGHCERIPQAALDRMLKQQTNQGLDVWTRVRENVADAADPQDATPGQGQRQSPPNPPAAP